LCTEEETAEALAEKARRKASQAAARDTSAAG